ncbi:hypothetical protein GCM10027053_12450 [Intrasporangium mesophilum]
MTKRSGEDERDWAADKRDFVADRRDTLADERDVAADTRDAVADERQAAMDAREAAMDERDRQQDERAAEQGLPTDSAGRSEAAAQRSDERAARDQERLDREELRAQRDLDSSDRDAATKRRDAALPSTRLAMAFAEIAEQLYSADTFDDVLLRIAQAAVSTVTGCDMASVTLSERGAYQTAATTDPAARAVDQAQYDAREGPSLDAVDAPIVYAQSFPDERWPRLASRPADLGAQSAASYRLSAASLATAGAGGSLNTYGNVPNAFTDEAQQIGLILAAHASMAAGAVHERANLQDLADNLSTALLTRDVIGQAKGILMERLKLTPEDAFDALRHSSQRLNEKLRAVARRLAETGEFDNRDLPHG